jgi:hypothetical protein
MGDLTAREEFPNRKLYPQLLLTSKLFYYEYQSIIYLLRYNVWYTGVIKDDKK